MEVVGEPDTKEDVNGPDIKDDVHEDGGEAKEEDAERPPKKHKKTKELNVGIRWVCNRTSISHIKHYLSSSTYQYLSIYVISNI